MDKHVLHTCLHSALHGEMSFPETVGHMTETGVERYRADLVLFEKAHYATNGEVHTEKIPLEGAPPIAERFSSQDVQSAIKEIQNRRIHYAEFLRRIMAAGTAEYMVYITGRRAIYSGRTGDFHIEPFPAAK
jgi:uncharacterized protein YbcV (DUF1398 family)